MAVACILNQHNDLASRFHWHYLASDHLNAKHEALASDVADDFELISQSSQCLQQVLADSARLLLAVVLFNYLQTAEYVIATKPLE
jgi:hypothetical protein